ncbi:MAG: hypothetical protein LBH13_06010 [Cellulomonadaceae bacterium]|jgi:hypothetical protein|nr:hypothetical protein [Cellulomonadaceae bacterium]
MTHVVPSAAPGVSTLRHAQDGAAATRAAVFAVGVRWYPYDPSYAYKHTPTRHSAGLAGRVIAESFLSPKHCPQAR